MLSKSTIRKAIYIAPVAVLAIIIAVLLLNDKEEEPPELFMVSMDFKNGHYWGGTEEVAADRVGELLGSSDFYYVSPDEDRRTVKSGVGYDAPVYMDKTCTDRTTVIVMNHRGKFVRLDFVSAVFRGRNGDFSQLADIFNLDCGHTVMILVDGQYRITERAVIEPVVKALLAGNAYNSKVNDLSKMSPPSPELRFVLESGMVFKCRINMDLRWLSAYSAGFDMSDEAFSLLCEYFTWDVNGLKPILDV